MRWDARCLRNRRIARSRRFSAVSRRCSLSRRLRLPVASLLSAKSDEQAADSIVAMVDDHRARRGECGDDGVWKNAAARPGDRAEHHRRARCVAAERSRFVFPHAPRGKCRATDRLRNAAERRSRDSEFRNRVRRLRCDESAHGFPMSLAFISETLLKRTTSRCPTCHAACPAEVWKVSEGKQAKIFFKRTCADHGATTNCISSDARFYWLAQGDPQNACCGGKACCADENGADGTLGRNAIVNL